MKHFPDSSLLLAILAAMFTTGTALLFAQTTDVPQTISYQGMLSTMDGTPYADGAYDITVTLYSDASGSRSVWSGTYRTDVRNGIFNLHLGSSTHPLPPSSNLNSPLWIGTAVNGGDELRPLTPLTASPYALNVPDKAITGTKLADRAVTAEKMGTPYVAGLRVNGENVTGTGTILDIRGGEEIDVRYDAANGSLVFEASAAARRDAEKGASLQEDNSVSNNTNWRGRDPVLFGGAAPYPFINDPTGFSTSYNTVVGGSGTLIETQADYSGIVGGASHIIDTASDYDFIGGGDYNRILDNSHYNCITCGDSNTIGELADHNFIGGGKKNSIADQSDYNTLGGGFQNAIGNAQTNLSYSFIGGGQGNLITAPHSVIGGGTGHVISVAFGTIGGGVGNAVNGAGNEATVAGGHGNIASGCHAFIGGGHSNNITTTSLQAAIAGGDANLVDGSYSAITGGAVITVDGDWGFIGGGRRNVIEGDWGVIGGGDTNYIVGAYGTIGGGNSDTVIGAYSTIGGGNYNHLKGDLGFIGGGKSHYIESDYNTIAGGDTNSIIGEYSSIGGGHGNYTQGDYNTIPGGDSLLTNNSYAQTAVGFFNAPRGSVPNRPGGGTISGSDDPLFMVGNGKIQGATPVRSNAFEVSYNGHSSVYGVNGSGTSNPAITGGTFSDNVILAWGDIASNGGVNSDFGVSSVSHPATGVYDITITVTDPTGTAVTINDASITVTIQDDYGTALGCTSVTATAIGAAGTNAFRVRTYDMNSGCSLEDLPFMFKVTGRP